MATEQYFQRSTIESNDLSLQKMKSFEPNSCDGFECNICLDLVKDPVVTFCGHLYCWPCIYKWIDFKDMSSDQDQKKQRQCPVCKAEVSEKTLIPLYGPGQESSKDDKSMIPQRPPSPRCGTDIRENYTYPIREIHRRSESEIPVMGFGLGVGGRSTNSIDPMMGMFGEMVYGSIFGNSGTNLYSYPNSYTYTNSSRFVGNGGNGSPRLRRHMMQTDESLSRVWFFLFCCVMLCLLLF